MDNENIYFSVPKLAINIKRINVMPGQYLRNMHFHNAVEIVRVDTGAIICETAKQQNVVSEGEIILINRRVQHRIKCSGTMAHITYIQIEIDNYIRTLTPASEHYLYEFINDSPAIAYMLFDKDSDLYNVFSDLDSELIQKAPCYESFIRADVFRLGAVMLRHGFFPDYSGFENDKLITKLMPAIRYADERYMLKITLEDVSKVMNMDMYYFCKLFKKAFGATFVDYVNFIRMKNAEHMLSQTDKNISEIAYECGFASVQYFNRIFKKRNNCSPREYRHMIFHS